MLILTIMHYAYMYMYMYMHVHVCMYIIPTCTCIDTHHGYTQCMHSYGSDVPSRQTGNDTKASWPATGD